MEQHAFCLHAEKKSQKISLMLFANEVKFYTFQLEKKNYTEQNHTKNELTIWKLLRAKMILKASCSVDNFAS